MRGLAQPQCSPPPQPRSRLCSSSSSLTVSAVLCCAVLCCAVLCCSVCLKRIEEMSVALSAVKEAGRLEQGIRDICRTYSDKADQRFCYYIGGSDDAATSLLRTVSSALMNHLPPTKVCEKLKAADGQICAVKYEQPAKPIDWATVDLNKMRVKELKHILSGWGETCGRLHREGGLHPTNQRSKGPARHEGRAVRDGRPGTDTAPPPARLPSRAAVLCACSVSCG